MSFDETLYEHVMSQPEALEHKLYRKTLADFVNSLTEEERQAYIDRRDDIERDYMDWQEMNFEVLVRLGFSEEEASVLMDKRLNSPGMRNVIRIKAQKILNPEEEKFSIQYHGELGIPVIVSESRDRRVS